MCALKIDMKALHSALANGPINVLALCQSLYGEASGNSSLPFDLEQRLKEMEAGFHAMRDMGNMEYIPFTVFPARERARYGFPDVIPLVKGENPSTKRRKVRNPDAKEQKQYWPLVAWGEIVPTESGEAYDGRWDTVRDHLESILSDAGFPEWLASNGYSADYDIRGTRAGVAIRLNSVEDSSDDTAAE